MKVKLVTALALIATLNSCKPTVEEQAGINNPNNIDASVNYSIQVIDRCEYVYVTQYNNGIGYLSICHKGNCKNLLHRIR